MLYIHRNARKTSDQSCWSNGLKNFPDNVQDMGALNNSLPAGTCFR